MRNQATIVCTYYAYYGEYNVVYSFHSTYVYVENSFENV